MGSGLGEKDTDDDKGRTGRTEPSAHARFVEKLTPLHTVLKKEKDGKRSHLQFMNIWFREDPGTACRIGPEIPGRWRIWHCEEYAQIYRIVLELFDKFVELLGRKRFL